MVSGVHLSTVCHNRVKSMVAAILHRQAPFLSRRIFLMHDFTSVPVNPIHGGLLFRPTLTTNGPS
jgi:hypothetical protein